MNQHQERIGRELEAYIKTLICRDKLEELNCKSAYITGRLAGIKDMAQSLGVLHPEDDAQIVAKDGSC